MLAGCRVRAAKVPVRVRRRLARLGGALVLSLRRRRPLHDVKEVLSALGICLLGLVVAMVAASEGSHQGLDLAVGGIGAGERILLRLGGPGLLLVAKRREDACQLVVGVGCLLGLRLRVGVRRLHIRVLVLTVPGLLLLLLGSIVLRPSRRVIGRRRCLSSLSGSLLLRRLCNVGRLGCLVALADSEGCNDCLDGSNRHLELGIGNLIRPGHRRARRAVGIRIFPVLDAVRGKKLEGLLIPPGGDGRVVPGSRVLNRLLKARVGLARRVPVVRVGNRADGPERLGKVGIVRSGFGIQTAQGRARRMVGPPLSALPAALHDLIVLGHSGRQVELGPRSAAPEHRRLVRRRSWVRRYVCSRVIDGHQLRRLALLEEPLLLRVESLEPSTSDICLLPLLLRDVGSKVDRSRLLPLAIVDLLGPSALAAVEPLHHLGFFAVLAPAIRLDVACHAALGDLVGMTRELADLNKSVAALERDPQAPAPLLAQATLALLGRLVWIWSRFRLGRRFGRVDPLGLGNLGHEGGEH